MAHVVEGPHRGGIVGHEGELVAVALLHDRRQRALAGRVEVELRRRCRQPLLREQLLGLGEGHAREGDGGNVDLLPEGALDLIRVLLCDAREHVCQPLLLEGHHVLVGVDPRDLDVHAGELRVVARGKGGVGAEHGPDLEYPPEARRHRHLLVELRRLRQVGAGVEVVDAEQLGARLAGRAHELRRMQLDEPLLAPELAHRVLGGGLDLEDQPAVRPAQVQVAPVDALVQR